MVETAALLEEAPARGAPAGPQGSSLAREAPSPGTHPAAHRREALPQHWASEPRALPAVTPAPPESTLAAHFCPQPPGPPPVVRLSLCRPAPRFPMVAALQMGLSLLPGGGCGAERTRGVKQALQKVANLQPECFGGFGTRTVEVKIGLENTKVCEQEVDRMGLHQGVCTVIQRRPGKDPDSSGPFPSPMLVPRWWNHPEAQRGQGWLV